MWMLETDETELQKMSEINYASRKSSILRSGMWMLKTDETELQKMNEISDMIDKKTYSSSFGIEPQKWSFDTDENEIHNVFIKNIKIKLIK